MRQTWIKLYVEILHDPKMARLTAGLWRRAIEMFLFAGKNGQQGILPPVRDMAWTLRISPAILLKQLNALHAIGLVDETAPEVWMVRNYAKRQAVLSPAERMRGFRLRSKEKEEQELGLAVTTSNAACYEAGVVDSPSTSTSPSPSTSASASASSSISTSAIERDPDRLSQPTPRKVG
jgi:hypothetical protein